MLTDARIRATPARPETAVKLHDRDGLHLLCQPSGKRSWRFRWMRDGRERLVTIGHYPDLTLAAARLRCQEMHERLRRGLDPLKDPEPPVVRCFADIAREWHGVNAARWSAVHAADVITSLARNVFPILGDTPVDRLDAPAVLACLRAIERRGAVETAHRLRQRIEAVFAYAVAIGLTSANPAALLKRTLRPVARGQQPAVTTVDGVRRVLAAVDGAVAHPVTKLAARLLALTAVRAGELRAARWTEFAMDAPDPTWIVPAARMKGRVGSKRDHIVPLSGAAVESLRALRVVTNGGPLVFPSRTNAHRPMSENAVGYLLNRLGLQREHSPHGFRAAFSSIMNERDPADAPIIEAQLAHVSGDRIASAYNRATHLARRRTLLDTYATLIASPDPATDWPGLRPAMELLRGPRR